MYWLRNKKINVLTLYTGKLLKGYIVFIFLEFVLIKANVMKVCVSVLCRGLHILKGTFFCVVVQMIIGFYNNFSPFLEVR